MKKLRVKLKKTQIRLTKVLEEFTALKESFVHIPLMKYSPQKHLKIKRVKILKVSDGVGLCLEINDDLMALEVNQDFLHEQMVKLGVSNLNTKPRNIVVLGGGDGGILKHCLKVKPRSVKVLELEEEMVQICKKYLPHISEGAFEDSKAKMIYGNAFDTIKKNKKKLSTFIFY